MPRPLTPEARADRLAAELRTRLGCPFLDETEAGAYLILSPKTLAEHRVTGDGPPYRQHFGRIAYHVDELDAWSAARTRRSTIERLTEAR